MTHTLIRNARLIDGNGGEPLDNAAVLIKENRIVAVAHEDTITLPDTDLNILDAGGSTLLPGLIDSHVHIMLEDIALVSMLTTPFSLNFYKAIDHMRRTLNAGITSVRDAGGADYGVKQAIERGLVAGPRMQISITVLGITGGHIDTYQRSGNQVKFFQSYPGFPDGICDGVSEVRKKVREVLRAGAEVIKVCSTGGVLSPTDHPQFTQFSMEELEVIVQEAAFRNGIRVMAHAQGMEGIQNAVKAGIHSIEHGIYLDEETCDMMIERGTWLVPTLLAPVAVLEDAVSRGMPEYGVAKSREVMDIHRESIALAHKMGVKIAMGTDAGVMVHGTNLRELGLMVDCGMTPMESIVATTKKSAECLGWDDKLGTIEPGKLADLVLCKTDPLTDIQSIADNDNITFVMQDGNVVKNTLS